MLVCFQEGTFDDEKASNGVQPWLMDPEAWNKGSFADQAFKSINYLVHWVSFILQSAYIVGRNFCISALHHIRASLTSESSKTIAAAIVGSRLDFCNSLLAGTSVSNLARLQLVQNTLARVVAQKPRFCHITPVLSDLHWLPVRHRISFKIATVTFRVLHFQQPSYLSSHPTICTDASTPLFFIFVDMCSPT